MAVPSITRIALLAASLSVLPLGTTGQLISLKTVPVAAGDQFLIFPSDNLAMGGVSIALDDRLGDPFSNPARGVYFGEPQFYSSPTFYSVSDRAGNAKTIPVGAGFRSGEWFGGAFAALQNLKRGDRFFGGPFPLVFAEEIESSDIPIDPNALSSRSSTNRYANLHIGRMFGTDLSLGASVFLADLSAIDGVEHLYANANGIAQDGGILDLRLGMNKTFEGDRKLEAVLLHNRFNMTHHVGYIDAVFDPIGARQVEQVRIETNLDHSRTWGAHLAYDQPIGTNGWRIGGIFTANRKQHPKIPNYEIMNIPRDPGYSNAFNLGLGLSKTTETTRFGLDLIYEPAMSETWAEAEGPVLTVGGDTIPDGGKTVENSFDFSNAYLNLGVTQSISKAALQFGLQVRSYDFHLDQWNNVENIFRRQNEDWMEWTPSWGLTIPLTDLEIRYFGRLTSGTGRPGIARLNRFEGVNVVSAASNDVLLAPEGPLTLQEATVLTHQITISIPVR